MWDAFKNWIFDCIAFFANFLGDWGLAIIVITIIFRLIVAPIMQKQIKSSLSNAEGSAFDAGDSGSSSPATRFA